MTYQVLTGLTTTADLLDAISDFAIAEGWTSSFATTTAIGLHKGDCFVAIGKRTTTPDISRVMLANGGTITDTPLVMTLATALAGGSGYISHADEPGGSSLSSTNHIWTNDWNGPFNEVHMFSGASGNYIHVVARTITSTGRLDDRFSHLSFGFLDGQEMTTDPVAYATGMWYEFWEANASGANSAYAPNKPGNTGANNMTGTTNNADTGHHYPYNLIAGPASGSDYLESQCHFRVNSFLDSTYFSSSPIIAYNQIAALKIVGKNADNRVSDTNNMLMDFASVIAPMNTSLGLPLIPLPAFYGNSMIAPMCYLGQFPNVRYVDMTNLDPGDEIIINTKTWKVFPLKQKNNEGGINYLPSINTWKYGLAFLKE
jgi:hypothetical protein